RKEWPNNFGRVEIIRWFDKNEVVTVLGHDIADIRDQRGRFANRTRTEPIIELGKVTHDLGICPVVPFQNILVPGFLRSVSDIEEAVGLNQHINFLLNAHEEGIKKELFAPLILEDPQKAPEDIDLDNPTEIIPLNAGGKAYLLQTSGSAQQTMAAELGRAQGFIEYVTGSSAIRTQGRQPASSIATGRSLDKGQAPQLSRIEMRQDLDAASMERMNEISVLMTGSLFPDDDIQLFGRRRTAGSLFKMTIKGRDLQDYVYNEVTYPPSMYMGLEQRIIAVQQIMGGNEPYATRRWAIEFLVITDHPDEMM